MSKTLPRSLPVLLAALCATGPLGIDMYLPSIPQMAADFGTGSGAVQLSLMTFFVGLMLGQLAYGPLSDKFGRKPMIALGLGVFVLGSAGCALAGSIGQLHAMRLLQGLGGSIGMVIAFAIIKDCFSGARMGQLMSLVLAVLGLCPVLAPMIGNGLQALASWRLIFWVLAGWGVLVALLAMRMLPETRKAGDRAAYRLGQVLQTYGRILADRRFLPFALTLCVAQAGFFAYIAGSSSVFISHLGLTPTQFSLLFAVNALGLVAAAIINPKVHARFGVQATYRVVNIAYAVIMLGLLLALATGLSPLWLLCAGLFASVALLGLLMPTGSQLAMLQQGPVAGTASALMGAMQFGCGALVSALSGALAGSGSIGLVGVMAGCAVVSALMCLLLFPRQHAA